jgi:ADP-ribose pyrophosphatase YjhB (NUDIX family)
MSNFRRTVAQLIQKYPFITRIPYSMYKIIQPKFSMGVVGVVFNEDGQVLLAEHVFHHIPWGLPGGWVDRNENPEQAVCREFQEEFQLNINVQKMIILEVTQNNHIDIAYLCETNDQIGQLSPEILSYNWVDLNKLPRLRKFHYRTILQAKQLQQEL